MNTVRSRQQAWREIGLWERYSCCNWLILIRFYDKLSSYPQTTITKLQLYSSWKCVNRENCQVLEIESDNFSTKWCWAVQSAGDTCTLVDQTYGGKTMLIHLAKVLFILIGVLLRQNTAGICDDWLEQLDMSAQTNETVRLKQNLLPPAWPNGSYPTEQSVQPSRSPRSPPTTSGRRLSTRCVVVELATAVTQTTTIVKR